MIFILLFAVGLYLATGGNVRSLVNLPSDFVSLVDDVSSRGRKLTSSTPATALVRQGQPVNESPDDLAVVASSVVARPVAVDAYILARVIRSERKWGGTSMEGLVIGHIAHNVAQASGFDRLLGDDQRFGKQGGSAYFSTSLDPYEGDLEIAEGILSGRLPDPTGGAKNFVHPSGFASESAYLAVKERWIAKGLTPVRIDGAPGIEVYS